MSVSESSGSVLLGAGNTCSGSTMEPKPARRPQPQASSNAFTASAANPPIDCYPLSCDVIYSAAGLRGQHLSSK